MFYEGHDIYSRAFNVKDGSALKIARFVKQDGQGGVTQKGLVAGDVVSGVCMEEFNPTGGAFPQIWANRQGVRVRIIGSTLLEAGGAINYGDQIAVGAGGVAVKAAAGAKVVGEAYGTAAAAGDFVLVFLKLLG